MHLGCIISLVQHATASFHSAKSAKWFIAMYAKTVYTLRTYKHAGNLRGNWDCRQGAVGGAIYVALPCKISPTMHMYMACQVRTPKIELEVVYCPER